MRLYPYTGALQMLTETQLRATIGFGRLDLEVQRRAIWLMNTAQDEGHPDLGIGGGWRALAAAEAEFYRRYTRTTQTQRVKLTDKFYDGAWWSLNPGEIGIAAPGNSWHTDGPPGSVSEHVPPVAIDWYRELPWMQQNCARAGLRSFQHIPGEGHHTQPVEYPGSRSEWRPSHKLTVWPLTEDEDEMQTAIAAVYPPSPAVTVVNPKTFILLPDGRVRHASGPDVAYATAQHLSSFPIAGNEHYGQLLAMADAYTF